MACPPRRIALADGCAHSGNRLLRRGRCLTRKRAAVSLTLAGRFRPAQQHVLELVAAHEIHWEVSLPGQTMDDAWACPDCRLMVCPTVHSPATYLTALHELGHLLAPGNHRRILLESELQAWEWAADNALDHTSADLAAALAAGAAECMAEYLAHARADRRHRVPGPGDPFWARLAAITSA